MPKLWRLVLPFSSSLFRVYRHFMLAKDHAAPEAVSERYAPFYGDETGHFITSEQRLNR
jgi:hypothetical protein